MEIGNKIGLKIRSAIKAKLVELGAYVDDELPDYIMVMVANKKTEAQMAEDLSLFLSSHTQKFTSWLHSLLDKLQSITSESTIVCENAPQVEKKSKADAENALPLASAMQPSPTATNTAGEHKPSCASSTGIDKSAFILVAGDKDAKKPSDNTTSSKHKPSSKEASVKNKPSASSQLFVEPGPSTLTSVVDALSNSSSSHTGINAIAEFSGSVQSGSSGFVITDGVNQGFVLADKVMSVSKQHYAAEAATELCEEPLLSGISLSTQHDEFDEDSILQTPVMKQLDRKHASSTKLTTNTSKLSSSDLESRKISVKSSENRKRQATAKEDEDYRPHPEEKRSRRADAKSRLGPSTHQSSKKQVSHSPPSRRGVMSSVGAVLRHDYDDSVDERHDPSRPAIGRVASVVRVSDRRSSVPVSRQANKSLLLKAMQQAEQSVARAKNQTTETTESTEEEHRSVKSRLGSQAVPVKRSRDTVSPRRQHRKSSSPLRHTKSRLGRDTSSQIRPDSGSIAVSANSGSSDGSSSAGASIADDAPQPASTAIPEVAKIGEEAFPVLGDDLNIDEIEEDIEEELESEQTSEQSMDDYAKEDGLRRQLLLKNRNVVDPRSNPNFVVTMQSLMGEDDDEMNEDDDQEEMLDLDLPRSTRNVVRVKPQTFQRVTEAENVTTAAPKKPHSTERCKFWPACKNADMCPYHHPTIPCKTFPACRFGDTCLYVHPNCKFDSMCRNQHCPYTHSTPRRAASAQAPVPVIVKPIRVPVYVPGPVPFAAPNTRPQVKCKYFPNCTDTNCTFFHPKPCRFGAHCANRQTTCQFSHPEWPDKKLMKWTAPSARPTKP